MWIKIKNAYTNPVIKAAKQNIVRIMPNFFCLAIESVNSTMYSIDVKPKLYTKSVPSVEYDKANPQTIEDKCWRACGMTTTDRNDKVTCKWNGNINKEKKERNWEIYKYKTYTFAL